jgi:hypothetical protein
MVESGVASDEATREREKNDRERLGDLKIPIKVGHRFCPFLNLLRGPYTDIKPVEMCSMGGLGGRRIIPAL